MSHGAIFVHRELQDHWLWQKSKPFSMGQAWIDMLLLANHKEEKVVFMGKISVIGRGEFIRSERDLSDRWGWPQAKTHRFLKLLKIDSMIVTKVNQKANQITICNYDKYQKLRINNESKMNQKRIDPESMLNLNNNDKNVKEVKKEDYKRDTDVSLSSTNQGSMDPETPEPGTSKTPRCPHKEIITLYHEILPELSRVQETLWAGSADESALRSRWKESEKRQSLEWWREFFAYVRCCKFLMGKGPSRNGHGPFQADLRWLVKRNNFIKVCEGRYADRA